ncbi:hypothetical protein MAE02_50240 [Microvirga aerophila]|uniref:Uncharacterized protein n=1 Tax=Microvirga aerophila TaxID=670291 RepID=A0A512BZF9_9HYPH|nr:hypothetical protein MAE02_50240 [Microvirga aerophila]
MPQKQPKKGWLWLNDGSCIQPRPEYPNHVWSYDFVEDRPHGGRKFRMLNVSNELTRDAWPFGSTGSWINITRITLSGQAMRGAP